MIISNSRLKEYTHSRTILFKFNFLFLFSFFVTLLLVFFNELGAQTTFPVNGVHNKVHVAYTFTNATIYVDYKTKIEKATLIVRDGKIENVGIGIGIPADAITLDLGGKFIYPSFIEPFSTYGMPEASKSKDTKSPAESGTKSVSAWNQALKPEIDAHKLFQHQKDKAAELRKIGFGAALVFNPDGIARGTSALVLTGDEKEHLLLLKDRVTAHLSFNKGSSSMDYPSSLMGAIALLRQTYLDAKWYANQGLKKAEFNEGLEAWNRNHALPVIFDAGDRLMQLRAAKIAEEFNLKYILKGSGNEYTRLDEIFATGSTLIVPLNFPDAYNTEDIYDSREISFEELKHWEMAPSNPAMLSKKGIQFALSSADLKDKNDFFVKLRKAVERGLSEEEALKSLTAIPAKLSGAEQWLGSLKAGMIANFFISSQSIFNKKFILIENWVNGKQYIVNDQPVADIRGDYNLTLGSAKGYQVFINGELSKPTAKITLPGDTNKINLEIEQTRKLVTFHFQPEKKNASKVRLSGVVNSTTLEGDAQLTDGGLVQWKAELIKPFLSTEKVDSIKPDSTLNLQVLFPFSAYGNTKIPSAEKVLFKNATVWTNEKEGILQSTDVLIDNGKIITIGKNLNSVGVRTIDCSGKHLTSGIIDEHSHIAISKGVNEGTQSVTAEVRIGDVINSEDVNIYRQLAGGVIASQLLHGSANCIGGQSGLVKWRWGKSPEGLKIQDTDGFIKFALGENVKQSNWGDFNTTRFPQTRMGVEQTFYDAFIRAKEYEKLQKQGVPYRKDLELDALVEILNNKRFITCHSYVQSEINMLMHVGDSLNFTVNTFTHILEGYKVADKMKKHGVGGSTFSDWWAYKFEVNDAIPYNAAMLHRSGIVTAINSDDAEMGRRLNQEAAKTIKYGGLSEEEAWKTVTLNPAVLLHLDKKTGSVKPGKDADLVVWSGNPLSIYSKAEYTFVDGACYFDLENDKEKQRFIAAERNRIIQRMIAAKKNGEKTQKIEPKSPQILYHCDTVDHEDIN